VRLDVEYRPHAARDKAYFGEFLNQTAGPERSALQAYLRGRLLARTGRHGEAVVWYAAALEHERRHPLLFLKYAESLRAAGRPEQAVQVLEAGLAGEAGAPPELWHRWFQVSAIDLRRPLSALAAFVPAEPPAGPAGDMRWLLDRLVMKAPVRINAGGNSYRDAGGVLWSGDRFFRGGSVYLGDRRGEPLTEDIAGTDRDPLYQTERWFPKTAGGPPGYGIPLPPGRYRIILHFAEIWYRQAGLRRFHVRLEGV
jgi:hypothetical protein